MPDPTPTPNPAPTPKTLDEVRDLIHTNSPKHPLLTASDQVLFFALLQTKYQLRIEVSTGLRHSRGSTLKALNHAFGTNFTRKQQALDFMEEICKVITDPIVEDPA
jgi:hypothetical protein